jgi:hypothetical protein
MKQTIRNPNWRLLSLVILAAGAAGLSITACGGSAKTRDKPPSAANYQFEPEPRAVLNLAGIRSSRDPKLAVDASGTLFVLAVCGDEHPQLQLLMSHDGGDTFMQPVPISEKDKEVSSHGENSPSLVIRPTEMYAMWEQPTMDGHTDLMFARSLTFGHSFDKPVPVTDKATPSFSGFSAMSAAPNGDVYAVWLDGRDPQPETPGTFSIYLAHSVDRGATFSRNVRVATSVCPCCRPTLTYGPKGEVYVAWRKVFPGDIRDMVVSASNDGGATFAGPTRVAVDNWRVSGCPHSGPAVASKGDRLYVAWYTEGADGISGIKLSWSDDGAKTFSSPVVASGNLLDANHPAFSTGSDGRVLLVFQARDPAKKEGWSATQSQMVEVSDSGTVSDPLPLSGDQKAVSYPAVATGTVGRVYLAWTEPGQEGNNIILLRGRKHKS